MSDERGSRQKSNYMLGSSLHALSVEELRALIVDIQAEIEIISLEIEKKTASKSIADDVFKI